MFFMGVSSLNANAQCGCTPGYFSKILQPGEVKNLSYFFPSGNAGTGFCFYLAENSRLIVDKNFTFSNCNFWQKDGSQIIINDGITGTFNDGSHLEECSSLSSSGGIQVGVNAKLIAPDLSIQGNGIMQKAITALTNSQVNLYNLGNSYALGIVANVIDCQDCALMRATDIQVQADIPFYAINCRPDIHIDNCQITGIRGGVFAIYSAVGSSPRLYIANSFFYIGNNFGSFTSNGAIRLTYIGGGVGGSMSFAPSAVTGLPAIDNCKVWLYNIATGINLQSVRGVTVNFNDVNLPGNIASGDIRLFTFGESPDCIITNNKATGSSNLQNYSAFGIGISNSPNCVIANNTTQDVSYGIDVSGNCSTPNGFSGNQFNGSQNIGLRLVQGATLGVQECMANKWNGTFSLLGAQNLSLVFGNQFIVKSPFPPDMPSTNIGSWFSTNPNCPQFGGGEEGESRSSEGIAVVQNVESGINVHPNPASSIFEIDLPKNEDSEYHVELTDLAGKLVLSNKVSTGVKSTSIDVNALSPGIYLIRVSNERIRHVEKIVITK